MTRLVACINTYGSPDSLHRALRSLLGQVDGVVVYDGPYAGWPRVAGEDLGFHRPTSCGYCFEVLRAVPIVYAQHGQLRQKTARSAALQMAAVLKPDWLLIFDDDEVFHCEVDLRTSLSGWADDYASVDVDNLLFKRRFPQNRLVRWTPGLFYDPNHWTIATSDGVVCRNASAPFYPVDPQVVIVNDPSLRSSAWKHCRSLYRMLQFIGNEGSWMGSKYFEGPDDEAAFVDPECLPADLESIKRSAASGNEFDMGMLQMLASIARGSDQDTIAWTDRTKGMVTGLLYATGVVPWPYAKKKSGGSIPP